MKLFSLNFSTPAKNVKIQPLVSVPVLAQALNDLISLLMDEKMRGKSKTSFTFQTGFM